MTKKITKLMLNGEEYEIREYQEGGRQPGANTVLYYDFEHTSGNTETDVAGHYNATYQGTPSIQTLSSGKKYFDTEDNNVLNTDSTVSNIDYDNATLCYWINLQNSQDPYIGQERWGVSGGTIYMETYAGSTGFCFGSDSNLMTVNDFQTGSWANVVIVNDGTNTTLYINGIQRGQKTLTTSVGDKYVHIGGCAIPSIPPEQTLASSRIGDAWFGSIIIENTPRTAQEASDYYYQTCGRYGITPLS